MKVNNILKANAEKVASPVVLFTLIDKYTFHVIIIINFLTKQILNILMITL